MSQDAYEGLRAEAHVWLARPGNVDTPVGLDACWSLLSADEQARCERLLRRQHRHLYVVAHALLRTTLSRYADVPATTWTFRAGEHGRPEVAEPGGLDLRFNLSHTAGLAACVVTRAVTCGVDVEQYRREDERLRRADRLLSPDEADALAALPLTTRRRRFFVHWTLKEAYVKARGIGLSRELDQVRFRVHERGGAQACFGPAVRDRAADWQFEWSEPTTGHALAVALHLRGAPTRRIMLREARPTAGGVPGAR